MLDRIEDAVFGSNSAFGIDQQQVLGLAEVHAGEDELPTSVLRLSDKEISVVFEQTLGEDSRDDAVEPFFVV
jgi:hypothetical protein